MKKKVLTFVLAMAMSLSLLACGNEEAAVPASETGEQPVTVVEQPSKENAEIIDLDATFSDDEEEEVVEEEVSAVDAAVPEGMYRSELTNEIIDESMRDQRPIAVMVDNDSRALPHYGINSADIVYEIMNSTANNRVTRLMVIKKDWQNITQFGSVRSVRPTNFMLAAEYNAVIIHDGGPFYIDEYLAKDYVNNLSGGFARFSNGKATEFTEYVTYDAYTNPTTGKSFQGLKDRFTASGYSTTYNEYYPGNHFSFYNEDTELTGDGAIIAEKIDIPFPNNKSKLFYNSETRTYDYYEHGGYHVDAADNNNVTTFKNAIIYSCPFTELDSNGYLVYNVINTGDGWYLTDGKAVPITWSKDGETSLTIFKNKNTGEDLVLNTGTTYIAVVPSDAWGNLGIN